MKRVRAKSWEALDALPEGEWVKVEGGLDIEVVYAPGARRPARVVIPLEPSVARSLRPREGEVLEARVRGRHVELIRRRSRGRRPAKG